MTTVIICWVYVVVFIIFFSFAAGLLLVDPEPMSIAGAIIIILIGVLTTINLVLTMPV